MTTKQPSNSREQKTSTSTGFPIVGVGASAGGLEACESLFSAISADIGLSFVVVVHLDPTHVSLMPELLQKKTKLRVSQVVDGTDVEINHIYVIPPDKEMHILKGTLYLTETRKPRQQNLPIDLFFRSLAEDQGSNAIAIILSGTGSDGSSGLKVIKEACGMVMAQSVPSAKYDGMPRSAVATGLVDFVLPANEMAEKLASYVKFGKTLPDPSNMVEQPTTAISLQKIISIILSQTENDFSQYKQNTIIRRIERRMNLHQIETIGDYAAFLKNNRREVNTLFKDLLIGVTNFFRDIDVFDMLKAEALPSFLSTKVEGDVIRVWVPGCSTGEEAYSLAITLVEVMTQMNRRFSVQIFGTDIDEDAIKKARSGLFPTSIEADVSTERLTRFFEQQEPGQYRIRKSIRDMLIFAPQNVLKDPPFTKLDLVSCRNMLIYFNTDLQKRLMPLFHYSIKPGGLLLLGSSESLGQSTDLFTAVNKKCKLFKREDNSTTNSVVTMPHVQTVFPRPPEAREDNKPIVEVSAMDLVGAILDETDTPPCVIIDDENDIVYIHGRTGHVLEPAEGKPSANILTMTRPGLTAELALAIHKVRSSQKTCVLRNIPVDEDDPSVCVDITVKPVLKQSSFVGLKMVAFTQLKNNQETSQSAKSESLPSVSGDLLTSREQALVQELSHVKESLQTTIEELKTSNEELQSTNEELQSNNEEMETSKEELQSLNEESTTVNAELQSRIEELAASNDDMKNLLDSTDIATIFLDTDLCVRRFTPRTTSIIPLVTIDAGRPLKHFASNLVDVPLVDMATQVLQDLAVQEKEVWSKDGLAYQLRMRPYRTTGNMIDGVVITFEDITLLKRTQLKMHENAQLFLTLSNFTPVGLFHAELSGHGRLVNPRWCEISGWTPEQAMSLAHILNFHPDDEKRMKSAWSNTINQNAEFNESYKFVCASGKIVKVNVQATTVQDKQDRPMSVVGTLRIEK